MTTEPEIAEKKRLALAELAGYRERQRRNREAAAAANQSAEDEIAEAIRARRADEEKRTFIRSELDRMYAEREARIEAEREADRQKKLLNPPRSTVADTAATQVAKLLRRRLGNDFYQLVDDLKHIDFKAFQRAVKRVPEDERDLALAAQQAANAARIEAEAATLPEPEDDAEAAILARHGFATGKRQAELNQGAL